MSDRASLSQVIRFRGLLANVSIELAAKDVEALAFIYKENIEDIKGGVSLMDRITKEHKITDCEEDLYNLMKSLRRIKRCDLAGKVAEYMRKTSPPPESSEMELASEPTIREASLPSESSEMPLVPELTIRGATGAVSSTDGPMEERGGDIARSTRIGLGGGIGYDRTKG